MRTAAAIIEAVQCVVSAGGSLNVRATTRSPTSAAKGGMLDGLGIPNRTLPLGGNH